MKPRTKNKLLNRLNIADLSLILQEGNRHGPHYTGNIDALIKKAEFNGLLYIARRLPEGKHLELLPEESDRRKDLDGDRMYITSGCSCGGCNLGSITTPAVPTVLKNKIMYSALKIGATIFEMYQVGETACGSYGGEAIAKHVGMDYEDFMSLPMAEKASIARSIVDTLVYKPKNNFFDTKNEEAKPEEITLEMRQRYHLIPVGLPRSISDSASKK